MNLHGIVSGVIGAINPPIEVTIRQSIGGYTTAPDGSRTPNANDIAAEVQLQALTGKEIQQLEGLNLQGEMRAAYLAGDWEGVVRADQKGGDLFLFNNQTWLAVQILETWPDWSKVALCRQSVSPNQTS